jgi:hypothetical protein
VLGVGRTLAYELVGTDAWPTPIVRAGKLIKIPTAPPLVLLATGQAVRRRRRLIWAANGCLIARSWTAPSSAAR